MTEPSEGRNRAFSGRDAAMLLAGASLSLVMVVAWLTWTSVGDREAEADAEAASGALASLDEVTLPAEALAAAAIESTPVTKAPRIERFFATGVVEPNQERIQQVTPLIGGRVEEVRVVPGDRVEQGAALLTLSSPEIAELLGDLRAAQARQAEADAALERTRQLVELGAGAGKELVAAEAVQRTTEAEVDQLRQRLGSLGVPVAGDAGDEAAASTLTLRAPMRGTVIERNVNPGAWIEAGAALVAVADLASVWVIVNLPEARLELARPGAPVDIRGPGLAGASLTGRVAYVDPRLDPQTRTARLRVVVPNRDGKLKIGMFVDVAVQNEPDPGAVELTVPADAVQRIGERTVVFVPTEDAGRFVVRDIELGDELEGVWVVRQGLAAGERVVTRGGFTLKSQLLKGQFGEDEELAGSGR